MIIINTYNVNDENYKNSDEYLNFINDNPEIGTLKIRAFAASQAIPISGMRIVVSKIIDNSKVIFFEGLTNESGIIENIMLPAPKIDANDMVVPSSIIYDIEATYAPDNISKTYNVRIYQNVYVVQNISIVPNIRIEEGGM